VGIILGSVSLAIAQRAQQSGVFVTQPMRLELCYMDILAVSDTATLLLAEGIVGSPKTTKAEALAEYAQEAGMGLTSARVGQVVPAAHHRRLGLSRIAQGNEVLVHFDREATSIPRREEPAPGDKDLLTRVALRTKSEQQEAVPGDALLVALSRH
jgi:hypothetical protein